MKTNTNPILMEGWEVETCIDLPVKDGETDHDGATYRLFDCKTKEEAIALAKKLLPKDMWGSVAVTEFIREPIEERFPHALRKEYTGDTIYIDEP